MAKSGRASSEGVNWFQAAGVGGLTPHPLRFPPDFHPLEFRGRSEATCESGTAKMAKRQEQPHDWRAESRGMTRKTGQRDLLCLPQNLP